MQNINQILSQRLKSLRNEQGWSLDQTSNETGVSKAMLGQIERGESNPTIATLWKIAKGFHMSLSYFIEEEFTDPSTPEIREANQLRQQLAKDAMLVAPLFPFEPKFGFELFELTVPPGYERNSEPHDKGVTEHVIVVEGEMEVLIDRAWTRLKAGSATRFPADKPHGYRNLSERTAVIHNLIYYP